MAEHFAEYAETVNRTILDDSSFVIEIGSNDGVLLQHFEEYERLGIEPASNVAAVAVERGIPTRNQFFSADLGRAIREERGPADVVMANNVVGHVDDLDSFMRGVDMLLDDAGTAIVEVPYLVDLLNGNEFDTIYHEHLSYFSVRSFVELGDRYDMVVADVERVPVHGGSIRVFLRKEQAVEGRNRLVGDLVALERAMGLDEFDTYRAFAERVEEYRDRIKFFLETLSSSGASIIGYGAPAKGSVLLNYCGIGHDLLDFVIDTTPAKQGKYTPGMNLPVRPPERLHQERPDYALLLAWNYRDSILANETEYRSYGRFIIPMPYLDIV